jgi:hypothetical protein
VFAPKGPISRTRWASPFTRARAATQRYRLTLDGHDPAQDGAGGVGGVGEADDVPRVCGARAQQHDVARADRRAHGVIHHTPGRQQGHKRGQEQGEQKGPGAHGL